MDLNIEIDIKQSQTMMRIINEKLKKEDWLEADQKESLAYRMASVMTASKNLYANIAPKLTSEEKNEDMLELFTEFRLHYLNLADLINEFEELFMTSIIPDRDAVLPDTENEEQN